MPTKEIVDVIISAFKRGNKILICGNGGSASMAQHMAAEFVCTFEADRQPLPAIALTTDSSILTAWSNDKSFAEVFARQVYALGKKGDVLIGISTSGKSENVLWAKTAAEDIEMAYISLPRKGKSTAKIQEYQLVLMHDIVREVEKHFI